MKHGKVLKEAQRLLALGRALTSKKAPYAADTLHGLVPHFFDAPSPGFHMGVTNRMVLYIDPYWLVDEPSFKGSTGIECIAGALFHEVNHVQRGLDRIEALDDLELAAISGDLAINCHLKKGGWLLPPWVLYPTSPRYNLPEFMPLEFYYRELKKRVREDVLGGLTPDLGSGKCGGVSFKPVDVQVEESLNNAHGRMPVDIERIRYKTAEATKRTGPGFGSLPGFFTSAFDFKKEPPIIQWNRILAHVTRRLAGALAAGEDDLSYMRPAKRALAVGMLRPGPVSYPIVPCIIRDTSASMTDFELNQVSNHVIDIMKQLGLREVMLWDADTILHEPKLVKLTDIPKLQVHGRGGTDFNTVLTQIARLKKKPDFIIYQTDGDGPAPRRPPAGCPPIIWAIVKSMYMRKPADWGTLVVCSNDPADKARLMPPYYIEEEKEEDEDDAA